MLWQCRHPGPHLESQYEELAQLNFRYITVAVNSTYLDRYISPNFGYEKHIFNLPYTPIYRATVQLIIHYLPTDTSKQPIRARCLGHVTGYQPISGPMSPDSVSSYYLPLNESDGHVSWAGNNDTEAQTERKYEKE